ncbi:VWA domain-containing protein [Thermus tengchongensis]|uniref:VWA domain-containing protein n=1 Tax=Thermus tengchongensis TaxID=1214928 RepID=A0ABY2K9I7_9DEIN|nr:VWA domain-containing protein [Thermus tengchongensis]TFU18060.1 VWA domain-containing protein [Thermus tengchongensis]
MLRLLRVGVLILLFLAFLDPRWPMPGRVVYLLDFSPSARESVFASADRLPRDGIYVAFAERAVRIPSPTARRLDLGEGTDLKAAFQEAEALKPTRVVLVSDGLFEPIPAPFPLDAVYVPPKPHVAVELVPPPYPLYGETVGVGVVLEAPLPTEARLRVEGPGGVLERSLRVEGRKSLTYTFSLTEEAEVRAVAEGPWGRSEARVRFAPVDRPKALVLGDPALARYLEAQGFRVEEGPFRLPLEADLVAVGLGVLDLPEGAPEALRGYLRRGGGLLFTATPKGLFFGGWDRSLPEDLPLKPLGRKGAALVLVLDVSGSMEGEKLSLAVAGALELVRSAAPEDYLGVVLFSSSQRVLFPPRPMTEQGKREAESLLLSVRAGGGTVLGPAFREAVRLLQGVPVERKGILVLSDGLISDPQDPILALAGASGLEVSAVALGPDADRAFLKALAERGGGRYYQAATAGELPRLFLKEGQEVFQGEGLEGRFPVKARPHPLAQGFSPPPLSVLLPARAEPWAEVVLESEGRAVLALGERGEGRVAALATDLSRSWRGWEGAAPFLGGLARYLMGSQKALALYTYPEKNQVRAVVLGRLENPLFLSGGREVPLVPTGPARYEVVAGEPGVLLDGKRRIPLTLPLPGEWTPRDGKLVLKALAEASQGRLLALEDLGRPGSSPLPLRPYLLALALVLFLLERLLEARSFARKA